MKSYKEYVNPYIDTFVSIEVPQSKVVKIREFVTEVIKEKRKEEQHQIDGHNEYKRFYTGTLGEAAIEELLGVDLIDWNIGNSNFYNDADLRNLGLNVGVKTVEYGKFPIVHVTPRRPEIIILKRNESSLYICGYANIHTLRTYQDTDLILSPSLKNKGTKTGFYGFSALQPFINLGVLKICMGIHL